MDFKLGEKVYLDGELEIVGMERINGNLIYMLKKGSWGDTNYILLACTEQYLVPIKKEGNNAIL